MTSRSLLAAALLFGSACATTLRTTGGGSTLVAQSLVDAVAFDHSCAPDKIVLLRRSGGGLTFDLDVCGATRRYKRFASESAPVQWLDVTSLYPPGSLPGKP